MTIVVWMLATVSSMAQVSSGAAEKGSIAGVVLDSTSRLPLGGATVTLIGDTRSRGAIAKTDPSGAFTFENITPGRYSIHAVKVGYVRGWYGQRSENDNAVGWLTVRAGEKESGLEVHLWRLSAIEGRIVDHQGEPIVEARVQVWQKRIVRGTMRFTAGRAANTDDRGQYRIADLHAGEYLVGFLGDSRQSAQKNAPIYYPDATTPVAASPIELKAGDSRTGVDFIDDVAAHRPGVALSGIVRGIDPNTSVTVQLIPTDGSADLGDFSFASSRTDGSGAFTLSSVMPGSYALRTVYIPQGARVVPGVERRVSTGRPIPSAVPLAPLPDEQTLWGELPVTVGTKPLTGIEFFLRPGFRVSGLVKFDGVGTPPEKESLPRKGVHIIPTDGRDLGRYPVGRIESDGRFRTVGVPTGRYMLGMLDQFDGWYLNSVQLEGREVAGTAFALEHDVTDAVIRFSSSPTRLGGTVRDNKGRTVPYANVVVFPSDDRLWETTESLPGRIRTAQADASGIFTVPLFPGKYLVVSIDGSLPADWATRRYLHSAARASVAVNVESGKNNVQDVTMNGAR
jgi:protocatechuate 3,4-dioxygenase beta subunit